VRADRDEKRELLTLLLTDGCGTELRAKSLSDGTLRFVALTSVEIDPTHTGLVCMEEPKNGIHPERIGALLRLLQDIAVDTTLEVADDNPLRQVIVYTHSPVRIIKTLDLYPCDIPFVHRDAKREPHPQRVDEILAAADKIADSLERGLLAQARRSPP